MNWLKAILLAFLFVQAVSAVTKGVVQSTRQGAPVGAIGVALAITLAIYAGLVLAVIYA